MDRLSNLPNPILINILSSLPTETAVATSVLSKSWRSLWTFVQDLDFDESRIKKRSPASSSQHQNPHQIGPQQRRFERFVYQVLLHRREWSIRRFRLKVDSIAPPPDFDLWVSSAIARNVQELDIGFWYTTFLVFPCTQQSCKILRVLKLRKLCIGGRLDDIVFPILEILHLEGVQFERHREVTFGRFLSPETFPVLRELVLKSYPPYSGDGDEVQLQIQLQISFPILRSLKIGYGPLLRGFTLTIDCPALRHLYLEHHNLIEFRHGNLCNLVEAGVDLFVNMPVDELYAFYGTCLMNLVKAASNVRILTLSYSTMREIQKASSSSFFRWIDIPIFHNLVRVELTLEGKAWNVLMPMLHKFENLESLTLCTDYKKGFTDEIEWIEPSIRPSCLTFRVTTVCFQDFRGFKYEMRVARYILESSLVLKKATFIFSYELSSEDGCRVRRELSQFSKGFEGCQLEYK